MLSLIAAELEKVFEAVGRGDAKNYAFHTGKAGGVAAATGAWISLDDDEAEDYDPDYPVYVCRVLCDAISSAYEYNFLDELDDILVELMGKPDDEGEYDDSLADRIGWEEYGIALHEACQARASDDELRFALMMGFASGLMFNDPGPSHPEYGTILDAIDTAYVDGSDDALKYAQARIAAGVRMTDPAPFMGKEQYDRYMAERLETLRWVQNFGRHYARAGDEAVAVPGSVAINHAVRQMTSHQPAENPPRPIEMCYWVVPGKLLAGEYPRNLDEASSREKLARLTDAGVSVFIDLTNPDTTDGHLKPYSYLLDGPTHQPFPIDDQDVPASVELTKAALDAIDGHLVAGRTVYVHCWGGVGRTGTIIGCWLARHHEPGQAALDRLKELWRENPKSGWRRSPETLEQEKYVREWDEAVAAAAGASTAAERITAYHRITNTSDADFNDLPRQVKVWYRDARIESESAVSFANLPGDVQNWYRQVAIAQVKADETGDYSELIALGAWPAEEEDERGE